MRLAQVVSDSSGLWHVLMPFFSTDGWTNGGGEFGLRIMRGYDVRMRVIIVAVACEPPLSDGLRVKQRISYVGIIGMDVSSMVFICSVL
jgi:hypothetical protein